MVQTGELCPDRSWRVVRWDRQMGLAAGPDSSTKMAWLVGYQILEMVDWNASGCG
jgi:hypothetical protein